MIDHGVLVPTTEGPVGGIVSEPDGKAQAGLFLIQGYGRPARSGTNSFWARLARRLCERGFVVLRVNYAGEGETLPVGEGITGKARRDLDESLLYQVLPWFHERLKGLDLFLAGSCSGARAAIELAGRDHPDAVAGTFLVVPHLRVLNVGGRRGDEGSGDEDPDPDAIDQLMVDCLQTILSCAPSWILVGEHDTPDIPLLKRLLGGTRHDLEVEVVPGAALHFLDQPDLQEEAGRRLIARMEQILAVAGEAQGSPAPPATGSA